jgi:hypothetical protein
MVIAQFTEYWFEKPTSCSEGAFLFLIGTLRIFPVSGFALITTQKIPVPIR